MPRPKRKKFFDEIATATIDNLSPEGRGIARINGKTTFIDNALPTETVEFKYSYKRKQLDEGYSINITNPAPQRVKPQCNFFDLCGGCSMQHMQHATQLELKQKTLLDQLKHFGNAEPENLLPPLTASIWGYRHKARLGVRFAKNKGALVGFREKRSNFLADINYCEVLHPSAAKLIAPLRALLNQLACYNEIPQIEVAVDDTRCALVFRHLIALSETDLAKLKDFAKQHEIYLYLQPKGIDSIQLFYPEQAHAYLSLKLPEYNIHLNFLPSDFTQINFDINKKMLARVIDLLNPQPEDTILDLFCGIGNFTLSLAGFCKQIYGVEGSSTAVERAELNARQNQINNAKFYCFDLTKDFTHSPWTQQKYDKMIIDPPRSGAEMVVNQLNTLVASQILYISCNPATLGRDAGILIKQGYRLTQAGIMDMFPHTSHVESIALFEK